jgi:hypothetical protein
MGGISFYTQNGQKLAKQKSSLDGNRVKTSPEFVNTRKNNTEFSQASQASKLMRDSFAQIVHNNSSNIVSGLTTAAALLVVQSDQANPWGDRLYSAGDQALMAGYEFNNNSSFASVAPVPYVFAINRTTGAITLDYAAFVPETVMTWPEGATDCSFTLMAGEMDFDTFTAVTAFTESAKVPLDDTSTNLAVLTATVTAASTLPLYAVAGIKFFKKVGADYNLLKNRAFDASYIIGIDA